MTDDPLAGDAEAGLLLHGVNTVEETLESFFHELSDADDAEGFKKLEGDVVKLLKGAKVVLIGGPKAKVYLAGSADNGKVTGVKTASVEM